MLPGAFHAKFVLHLPSPNLGGQARHVGVGLIRPVLVVLVYVTLFGWPVGNLLQVLRRWRVWAPLKHAQRRRLRDAVTALHSSTRRRIWCGLRDYTATWRVKGAARRRAQQHFRWGHAWQ